MTIVATLRLSEDTEDKDLWAVDLIEGSDISERLKAGWFWASSTDLLYLYFVFGADENEAEGFAAEIKELLEKQSNIVGRPELRVEVDGSDAKQLTQHRRLLRWRRLAQTLGVRGR